MSDSLREELDGARETVMLAETAVNALLAKLAKAPRAEKIQISAPLEDALLRLRDARAILAGLDVDALT